MSSLQIFGQNRFAGSRRRADTLSFAVLLTLTVASALTGAVAALVVQRFIQRRQYIEVLPQPAPVERLQEHGATGGQAGVGVAAVESVERAVSSPAQRETGGPASPLAPVAGKLTAARTAELERLVAESDDVVAGDGSVDCPADFPIKGTGRSGIYHWPGALGYAQTRPTVCFRTTDAAERAGFRPAKR